MTKFKKAMFVFCIGLGLSASLSNLAYALPDLETCLAWVDQCDAGNQSACSSIDRLCKVYGIYR